MLRGESFEPGHHPGTDARSPIGQALPQHYVDHGERCRASHRISSIGSAEPTYRGGLEHVGAPGDGGQRQAATQSLGRRGAVGDPAAMPGREELAGTPEAGLDFVGNEENAVVPGESCESLHVLDWGDYEPALAQLQFHDDRGNGTRIDDGGQQLLEARSVRLTAAT